MKLASGTGNPGWSHTRPELEEEKWKNGDERVLDILKNFSRKLFTSKIKKKEEETKSSVWDLKTPKLAQIHQQ